jgi:hypothetical protein
MTIEAISIAVLWRCHDRMLLWLTFGLAAIGFIMVTSASMPVGQRHHRQREGQHNVQAVTLGEEERIVRQALSDRHRRRGHHNKADRRRLRMPQLSLPRLRLPRLPGMFIFAWLFAALKGRRQEHHVPRFHQGSNLTHRLFHSLSLYRHLRTQLSVTTAYAGLTTRRRPTSAAPRRR